MNNQINKIIKILLLVELGLIIWFVGLFNSEELDSLYWMAIAGVAGLVNALLLIVLFVFNLLTKKKKSNKPRLHKNT